MIGALVSVLALAMVSASSASAEEVLYLKESTGFKPRLNAGAPVRLGVLLLLQPANGNNEGECGFKEIPATLVSTNAPTNVITDFGSPESAFCRTGGSPTEELTVSGGVQQLEITVTSKWHLHVSNGSTITYDNTAVVASMRVQDRCVPGKNRWPNRMV